MPPIKKIIWKKRGKRKKFAFRTIKGNDELDKKYAEIIDPAIDSDSLVPFVVEAANSKEELITLLKFASEVEHALMIQYLYAAYTIEDDASNLKETLLLVARQEMGHFLCVQNLLISLGGIAEVHLYRSMYRQASPDNPLPYSLQAVSKLSLAKFMAVEAPPFDTVPEQIRAEVIAIHQSVKDTGIKINPVGALYKKLESLIETEMTDADFQQHPEFEADRESWDFSSAITNHGLTLAVVHKKDEALAILKEIASQGEGADLSQIDSHFEEFLVSYRNFAQQPPPLISAPINPVTGPTTEFESFTIITNDYTLLWAGLLNNIYSSLLLDIYSTLFYPQFNAQAKQLFIRSVFNNMRRLVSDLSNNILRLPLSAGAVIGEQPVAGPTFEIDPAFSPTPDRAATNALHELLMNKVIDSVKQVRQHSAFTNHIALAPRAKSTLKTCEEYCTTKKQILSQL